MLSEMNIYTKRFNKTKYMAFFDKNELLGKYNKIWGKVSNKIKK